MIKIICVGKLKEKYWTEAVNEYLKRLSKYTKLQMIATTQEKEKAFHDVLLKVKENSLEYYSSRLGSDVTAINQVIEGKKALETLKRTHISFQD